MGSLIPSLQFLHFVLPLYASHVSECIDKTSQAFWKILYMKLSFVRCFAAIVGVQEKFSWTTTGKILINRSSGGVAYSSEQKRGT